MGWRSFIVGFAAFVAVWLGAWAQTADAPQRLNPGDNREVSAVQLPARIAPAVPRGSEGVEQPRYATMTPPVREDSGIERAPVAAPAARVQVGPDTPPANQPRYATQNAQDHPELVTVVGLRQSEDSLYRLGPGDKLRVTVFNEGDLSGDFTIDGQGFVRLPLVGQVQAAGLTSFGLESRIGESFVNGGFLVNPKVAVEITTYRPFYIIGEVAKPGEYAYINAMTAPNAIALAGGYTEKAVESTIWIRRLGQPKEREFRADESTRIQPGDVVRVDRSTYWSVMTLLSPIISPFSAIAYLLK